MAKYRTLPLEKEFEDTIAIKMTIGWTYVGETSVIGPAGSEWRSRTGRHSVQVKVAGKLWMCNRQGIMKRKRGG